MRLPTARLAAILVVGLIISACASPATTGSATSAPTKKPVGGNLNVRVPGDFGTLDPSGSAIPTGPGLQIMGGVYDRLLGYGTKGEIVPYVATSWMQPDATTIVFELRGDVTCVDGTPLTPTDIANSLARLFKSPNATSVFGSATPVFTPDDTAHRLTVKWSKPNADGLFGFSSTYSSIPCRSGLSDPAKLDKTPSGSGPYTLSSLTQGVSAKLVKNPAWKWGPSNLTSADMPDSITLQVVANDTTAANQLITGELDASAILGPDIARLNATPSLVHVATTSYKLVPLMLNATPGHATADPQVRRAIMTAIDPAEWNKAAYNGTGATGTSLFAKNALCYEPATAALMPVPSLAKAKEILLADGYAAGSDGKFTKNGKVLAVTVAGSPAQWGHGMEYVAAQLTTLGMAVTLSDLDRALWIAKMRSGDYDVTAFPLSSQQDVPSNLMLFVGGPLPPKGTNYAYTVDPEADAALDAALSASPADRCKFWSAYQIAVLKNFDMLPLAGPASDIYVRQGITTIPGALDLSSLRRSP